MCLLLIMGAKIQLYFINKSEQLKKVHYELCLVLGSSQVLKVNGKSFCNRTQSLTQYLSRVAISSATCVLALLHQ